jgi:putative ABC transport system ATP-binding protein
MKMLAIDLRNLSFSYSNTEAIPFSLQIDEFKVEKGQSAVLYGPSGCGKSTLLNLVAGELLASSGQLKVLEQDLCQFSEEARRAFRIQNIGFVFQDFPLVNYLSAFENILLPYRINPSIVLDTVCIEKASSLLFDLGLEGKSNRKPSELSQGERQRVAIARALVVDPALLLADEPTAGLDEEGSHLVMELLESLVAQRDMSMIVVTHNPKVRARFNLSLDLGQLR